MKSVIGPIVHALEFCRMEGITNTAEMAGIVDVSIKEYTDANSVEYDLLCKVLQVVEKHGNQLDKDALDDLFTYYFCRVGMSEVVSPCEAVTASQDFQQGVLALMENAQSGGHAPS
jgi:hypothetical protein